MRCPYCGDTESKVVDSRDVSEAVRRRRECINCGARFTTYERLQPGGLFVVKKDVRREEFDKDKLMGGLRKACEKRPMPAGVIEKMAGDIENELYRLGRAEVASYIIGDMVMARLKEQDNIAYIRFASVYRKFTDITELKEVVDNLIDAGDGTEAGAEQLPLMLREKPVTLAGINRKKRQ
jgi:transcriptional repressor NrdR